MGSSVVLNAQAPEFYPNTLHKLVQQPPQYNNYSYYPFHLFYPSSTTTTTKHPHPFYYPSHLSFHFHPNHQHSVSKHEPLIKEDPHRSNGFKGNNHVWRRKQEPKDAHVAKTTNHHHNHKRHYSFKPFPLQRRFHNKRGGGGGGGGFPEVPVFPDGNKTTVMIKNIPSKYTREMLVEFLENHCMLENAKDNENGEKEATFAFDFVYLPIDFTTGFNKGYAFVNFTNPKAAWEFVMTASNKKWELFLSNKIRRVIAARLQGKEELEKHFERMNFPCETEEVLPVSFSPPRDGVNKGSQKTMGKLSTHKPTKMPL